MKFYKNLYIGNTVKKPNKLIKQLKKNKLKFHVYLIIYNQPLNRLEILNSVFLHQWFYKESDIYIIGISLSKEEAFDLMNDITQDTVSATNTADIIEYLFGNRVDMDIYFN